MESQQTSLVAFVETASKMGGVEFSTLYLAQELDRQQFNPLVICPEEGDLPQRCREANISVEILPRRSSMSTSIKVGKRYIPNLFAWLINLFFWVAYAIRLSRLLKRCNVHLVCTKGLPSHFYGGVAAKLSRLPCVWHVQDLVSERAGDLYPLILGTSGRLLARVIIADGSTILGQLSPYFPAKRIRVVHNGVDIYRFSPDIDGTSVRNEWSVKAAEILIGNVARLTQWKGQMYLVHAFTQIADEFPNTKLVLVGSPVFDNDTFEKSLRTVVRERHLGTRVIFAGYRWDLPEVLAGIDIFVHPSIEKDTSPLAIVSAMASGKPIITTLVGGIAELFQTKEPSAILIPAKNTKALVEALRQTLTDVPLRESLRTAARTNAETNLSLPIFAHKCQAVFAEALSDKRL